MRKDVLFRGCTRPATILGVPYLPFLVGAGLPLLLAMYISLYILIAIPLAIIIMRLMAKKDEMIFRLLGLNLVFRLHRRNNVMYDGMWVFGPVDYRRDSKKSVEYEDYFR